ncbi:MAG: M48 family metallopeptidase [Dehalogenimonas sp.]|jgi:STE24 endopeptidase|uniref:M48 family metallopeptidase n=1 Tax=Candidatus Dehalogenimonas loeffleri TaxID=3127115 RepID=A0ABZ2JA28_9CHLR|nr:M48 family metallopeptidase [Dehalogenimonas sp.]
MSRLDADRQQQAAEYARRRRRWSRLEFGLTAVLAAVLLLSPLSATFAAIFPTAVIPAAALYFVFLMVILDVVTLPLIYVSGLKLPRDYGLSRQDFRGWLGDHVKSLSMGIVFGAVAVGAVYGLMLWLPDWWWLGAWTGLMVVTLLLTVLAPVFIIPMFFKLKPMAEGDLKDRLEALAERTGVQVGGIYVMEFAAKTAQANAAVMGLGRTKRVAISDTLIDQYTPEEIELVMAHELGHQRHNDVWRLYTFQGMALLAVFALAAGLFSLLVPVLDYVNITDPAALPLLLTVFFVAGLPAMPLLSWFSRRREKAADAYALEVSGNPEVFISAMTRLTDQNLAEARPSGWLERLGQDHPSYEDRVKMAEDYSVRN